MGRTPTEGGITFPLTTEMEQHRQDWLDALERCEQQIRHDRIFNRFAMTLLVLCIVGTFVGAIWTLGGLALPDNSIELKVGLAILVPSVVVGGIFMWWGRSFYPNIWEGSPHTRAELRRIAKRFADDLAFFIPLEWHVGSDFLKPGELFACLEIRRYDNVYFHYNVVDGSVTAFSRTLGKRHDLTVTDIQGILEVIALSEQILQRDIANLAAFAASYDAMRESLSDLASQNQAVSST